MENEWRLEFGFPLPLFTTGYTYSDKYSSNYYSQADYAIFLYKTNAWGEKSFKLKCLGRVCIVLTLNDQYSLFYLI